MRSSTIPPCLVGEQRVLGLSVVETLSRSFESISCRKACAAGPSTWISPMCETSKAPAVGADGPVLLDDALVLDGHLVAREGHHARAERDVARVERRALERGLHGRDSID